MSGGDLWIVIPNWERFQHYTDRNPPWIKLYTELAHDDAWNGLSLAARGLLTGIWIEFCASGGLVKTRSLPSACRQKVLSRTLDSLVEAGFIQLSASKPSRARSREHFVLKRREERASASGDKERHARAPQAKTPAEPERTPEPERSPNHDQDALRLIHDLHARMGWRSP